MELLVASAIIGGVGCVIQSSKKKETFENKKNIKNNEILFNKIDCVDTTLPVEFNNEPENDNINSNFIGYSLSGEPMYSDTFIHNNMTPFFGSHVRQNVDEYSTSNIFENYTGQFSNERKKTEINHMFSPEANITNPYGMSNLSGYQRERYIPSNKRNNEAPTEKVYVGPGINKGYTHEPSGGFQQSDTRDYILPKHVDELRVKSNPKLTYIAPVISGSKPSKPGKMGILQKNRPDSFAVWSPDRYFVTNGERTKPKQNSEVILRHSNRTTTDIRNNIGPAGPREGASQESIRANVRITERQQYDHGGPRGVHLPGQWGVSDNNTIENYVPMKQNNQTIFNQQTDKKSVDSKDNRLQYNSIHDYGKGGYSLHKTNRDDTYQISSSNVHNTTKQAYIPITSDLRNTRKEDGENKYWVSNIQPTQKNNIVWDPNDTPKTTVNETTLQETPHTNLSAQKPSNPPVYDPDDILKTTNKETTMSNYSGNAYQPVENGRECNTYIAQNTNRQFMSDIEYYGNVEMTNEGGYQIAEIDPRQTNRQYTSNNSHVGNAGNAISKQKQTKEMVDNITTRSYREPLSKGRIPISQGVKKNVDKNFVNATTNKTNEFQNMAYNQRKKVNTKVYNQLPNKNSINKTKMKKNIDNTPIQNRLDSRLLDEYKKNPYTQALDSHWTY